MTRTCDEPDCDRPHLAKGCCKKHYRRKYGRGNETATYPCAVCGTLVTRYNVGPARRAKQLPTCSNECRNIVGRGWRTDLPDDHPARWYGATCDWTLPLPKPKPIRFVSAQCAECGEWFVGDRKRGFNCSNGAPYCSRRCLARKHRRTSKAKRRARKRDAYVADVVRRRVHEADGWRCHICGKKVKRAAEVPHPLAPTIDHVIPLADGGTHEPANCRTAHFICNSLKGAHGGGEQMLLLAV